MTDNVCFLTGLPAYFSFDDFEGKRIYVCKEIHDGAKQLFDRYCFEDHNLNFQNALDSVISNLCYEAEKKLGKIEGKEHEAFKCCQKPVKKSLWNKYFNGK
jgi:hypothetical protein